MFNLNDLSPWIDERDRVLAAPLRTSFFDLIDSMGHSRFVLRILVFFVSAPSPPQQTFHRTRRRSVASSVAFEVAWPPEDKHPARVGGNIPIRPALDALSDVIRDTQDGA